MDLHLLTNEHLVVGVRFIRRLCDLYRGAYRASMQRRASSTAIASVGVQCRKENRNWRQQGDSQALMTCIDRNSYQFMYGLT